MTYDLVEIRGTEEHEVEVLDSGTDMYELESRRDQLQRESLAEGIPLDQRRFGVRAR